MSLSGHKRAPVAVNFGAGDDYVIRSYRVRGSVPGNDAYL